MNSSQEPGPVAARRDRVALVDPHRPFVDSMIGALVDRGYDARAVTPAATGPTTTSLRSAIMRTEPRLVLLEIDLGAPLDGISLVAPLTRAGVDVVVLTDVQDRGRWGEAVHAGARAVLSKTSPPQEALTVVRRVCQGLAVQSVEERHHLLAAWHRLRVERAVGQGG